MGNNIRVIARLFSLATCLALIPLYQNCGGSFATVSGETQDLAGAQLPSQPGSPPALKYYGRFDFTDPLGAKFTWSGSSIVATFVGTSVSATLDANGIYFDVIVDGGLPLRLATSGKKSYTLATGLPNGTHTVILMRDSEGIGGTTQFLGFDFGAGELQAPAAFASSLRLEFIGDSITCGFGSLGACGAGYDTEGGYASYAQQTPVLLGAAPATVLCQSGQGLVRNYGEALNGTAMTMSQEYLYTFTPNYGTLTSGPWTFPVDPSLQPNVVVVNLGTNDQWDGTVPGYYQSSYLTFVQSIRAHYPSAQIILAMGPMTLSPSPEIRAVVASMNNAGDTKVHYLEFPITNAQTGCDGHPSKATHAALATQLAAEIRRDVN